MTTGVLGRIDDFQRRRRPIGFAYAVVKRYFEDHGPWLGSLISYYGFFSLYPLMIVFASVCTWLFRDRPDGLQRVLEALWSHVPFAEAVARAEVQRQVSAFEPNNWVLLASLLITLWGGLSVTRVLQDAVNSIWGVARFRRRTLIRRITRSLAMVGLLGLNIIVTAVVAGIAVAADLPLGGVVLAASANVVFATFVAVLVYRLALATPIATTDVLAGALTIAVGTLVISLLGGLYVQRVVGRMTSLYGPFASTIGLLAYITLLVQLVVLATEVNVVRAKRLWPRSMTSTLHEPDRRAIRLTMTREALVPSTLDGWEPPPVEAEDRLDRSE